MSFFRSAIQFLTYTAGAKRWDAFHSPFLFDLFSYACDDKVSDERFNTIEYYRRLLLQSASLVGSVDYGAGSLLHNNEKRISIAQIAGTALSFPWQCRFMARIAVKMHPSNILELGTSLGIAGAYLATASPQANVITVEGNTDIANKAKDLFNNLGLTHITVVNKSFSDFLHNAALPEKLDLVFLDGHHQKEPLLDYYTILKKRFHQDTIVIVDDIHWSNDMYDGWRTLINSDEITQSVDCFQFGLLFFRNDFLSKEHHRIRLPLRSLASR